MADKDSVKMSVRDSAIVEGEWQEGLTTYSWDVFMLHTNICASIKNVMIVACSIISN